MDKSDGKKEDLNTSGESIGKIKSKIRRKRKRIESDSSSDGDDVLPDNTLDVERSVHAAAIKNNLDEASVKKILKKVITNDHVLALVKLREEEEDSGMENNVQPVTRAKAKKVQGYPSWVNIQLTPIKHIPVKTRPEVKALIAQEMPDDEDDEEYEPTPDDVMSDDDHIIEPCASDLELRPKTASTLGQNNTDDSKVQDGTAEVAQEASDERKKVETELEEATIALRTRSKLSLSETPIEHIEGVFEPPEIEMDDLWSDFLNNCLNPASNVRTEDDDETDPEYSVAADPDANDEDEALENSIIKISKKELNDLVTELFNVMPQTTDELNDIAALGDSNINEGKAVWEGKVEPQSDDDLKGRNAAKVSDRTDNIRYSIGKTEPADVDDNEPALVVDTDANGEQVDEERSEVPEQGTSKRKPDPLSAIIVKKARKESPSSENARTPLEPLSQLAPPPPPILRNLLNAKPTSPKIVVEETVQMYPQQVQILQQQLRMHIQLAASNFMQLFVHPLHWSCAPKYKGYLESLHKMTLNKPNSVVNVCNLHPAVELVRSWEYALAEHSPESIGVIKFIENDLELCRRRANYGKPYPGDFPDMFKNVVANSSVFLYPYLLPPMPYKSEYKSRRLYFLKSEDHLIVLGLDQFLRYAEANPHLYPRPRKPASRARLTLTVATRLTAELLLPAVSPASLATRVRSCRRGGDDNIVTRYLKYKKIEPVKHKLLPYNPKITLYEQPEFEMPRIWIKYLAKSSKRFREYFMHRQRQPPAGLEVPLDGIVEAPEQPPAPIDFERPFRFSKTNAPFVDKVDVQIQRFDQNEPTKATAANTTLNATVLVATNTLVNTSDESQFTQLKAETSTVNCNNAPILTPAIVSSVISQTKPINPDNVDDTSDAEDTALNATVSNLQVDDGHCKCCKLIKNICRKRQTVITEYFNGSKKSKNKVCDCRGKKYPRITNKLRLLANNFKTLSSIVFNELVEKLNKIKNKKKMRNECEIDNRVTEDSNFNDLVAVVTFQIKLVARSIKVKSVPTKAIIYRIFEQFNVDNDDPLELVKLVYEVFDVELADLYKEFLGFLTPQQADQINSFKDYFVRNCVQELIVKVEEDVQDLRKRQRILKRVKRIMLDNKATACEICCKLLECVKDYPELARYIYSLFPHRWRERPEICSGPDINKEDDVDQNESILNITTESASVTTDYEADNSSSDDDDGVELRRDVISGQPQPNHSQEEKRDVIQDAPTPALIYEHSDDGEIRIDEKVDRRDDSSDDSMCMLIMSEDESFKVEQPDWKRDEDKLILEVLKDCLSPDEMKDKTLIDIIENKNIVNMIAESLLHKSLDDVRARILYLLEILVNDNVI